MIITSFYVALHCCQKYLQGMNYPFPPYLNNWCVFTLLVEGRKVKATSARLGHEFFFHRLRWLRGENQN